MMKVDEMGECITCGVDTNIKLNSGVFACQQCLYEVTMQQKNIKDALDISGIDINVLIALLEVMNDNGCTKTLHCIKSLKAINLLNGLEGGKCSEKFKKELEKNIDILK